MIPLPIKKSFNEKMTVGVSKYLHNMIMRNYKSVKIGDIAQVVSGGTPSTTNRSYWNGNIVWITPKDLGKPRNIEITSSNRYITNEGLNSSSARLLPTGTVLLSSRAPIGYLGISAVPLCTNQGFKNIICGDELYNRFLFHTLRVQVPGLQSAGRGNTFKEITGRIVKDLEIPLPPYTIQIKLANFLDIFYLRLNGEKTALPDLPPPLVDQKRIVAKIELLMMRVDEANRLKIESSKETEEFFRSVLNKMFKFSDTLNYQIKPISSLATIIRGKRPIYQQDSGKVVLNQKCVRWDTIKIYYAKEVSDIWIQSVPKKYFLQKDDLVVNSTGEGTIGRACVVTPNAIGIPTDSHVLVVRTQKDKVLPHYLSYFIRSPFGQAAIEESKGAKTTKQTELGTKKLGKIVFPVPSLSEQKRIVAFLDSLKLKIEKLKDLQAETATQMDKLMPNIFNKALKGKL